MPEVKKGFRKVPEPRKGLKSGNIEGSKIYLSLN